MVFIILLGKGRQSLLLNKVYLYVWGLNSCFISDKSIHFVFLFVVYMLTYNQYACPPLNFFRLGCMRRNGIPNLE